MEQSLHYLLMISHTLFQKRVFAQFAQKGLTAGQPKILDYLGKHNGCVQKNIAEGCQIEPATLTGILNRMEEKGLLQRRMENGNRRSFNIYLTELGWQKQKEITAIFEQQEKQVLSYLTMQEQQILQVALKKLCCGMIDTEALQ